ncbi:ribosome maturation factor RimM [Streptococcus sp. CSL10205-OR2]|uniref:ribosome maturation factor RimM n=1 Tax=Streptococcus sp. CSL10205-OR2 TaxID=2980558 RepID=UPI0021D8AE2E|nr:ribosome maturation factor RimM [Streptococcus sp. CSL10205-OR2]MCU9534368.1 ribosome maturation factor RimM [Streptococcus sp. CSL10205-OR2]
MNYFNVGKIVNTQGLKGEVRVLSVTDFVSERYRVGSQLALFDRNNQFVRNLEVASHRQHKNFDILKFKDLYHINDVEKFKDFSLKIAEELLTPLASDEFYYHEIIGLSVYEKDNYIGEIKEILQPGANDVWVVKRKGKKDLLLPYIPSVILSVNLSDKKVEVDILEGLDDEN